MFHCYFPHCQTCTFSLVLIIWCQTLCTSVALRIQCHWDISFALCLLQEDFKFMIEDAGFYCVKYHNLTGGIVALHSGFKLWDALLASLVKKANRLALCFGLFCLYDKLSAEFSDMNFRAWSRRAPLCRCHYTMTGHIYWFIFQLISSAQRCTKNCT